MNDSSAEKALWFDGQTIYIRPMSPKRLELPPAVALAMRSSNTSTASCGDIMTRAQAAEAAQAFAREARERVTHE